MLVVWVDEVNVSDDFYQVVNILLQAQNKQKHAYNFS